MNDPRFVTAALPSLTPEQRAELDRVVNAMQRGHGAAWYWRLVRWLKEQAKEKSA